MSILQFPHSVVLKKVEDLLQKIGNLSGELQLKPVSHQQQLKIFHQQVLRSSLFSARIEGNKVSFDRVHELDLANPKQKSDQEIANVVAVLQDLEYLPEIMTLGSIKKIHAQVMEKIDSQAGTFRAESSAIYDGWGNIVYLTPSPDDMHQMLAVLLQQMQTIQDPMDYVIKAGLCHYYFEKIHPFIDGNGRVGRVLLQYQLRKTGLFAGYVLPIDQYFEQHRAEYYHHLEKNTRQLANFVEFYLKGIVYSLEQVLDSFNEESAHKKSSLMPRRQEIFHIISDHPHISLDGISRRFPTIPTRTISYDVNALVKKRLVIKHGETRGVRYSVLSQT
jgi:Fic family protein